MVYVKRCAVEILERLGRFDVKTKVKIHFISMKNIILNNKKKVLHAAFFASIILRLMSSVKSIQSISETKTSSNS